ncbi:MAG: DUF11 domain-containing protein, partial [Planctomycetes bacterium]|nr:DUF11 domain-containing protein [Planctomycetota bacterium]
ASVTAGATGSDNTLASTVNIAAGAGNSVVFTVTGTVLSSATGSLVNTSTVTAPVGTTDPTPGNNTSTDTDTPSLSADLAILKTDGTTSYVPGGPITYTITVTNNGLSDVTGATIDDTIPATLAGISWTSNTTGTASVTSGASGSGNLLAAIVNVAAGAGNSVVFTITGTALSSATGNLVNTATVTPPTGTTDPTPGNNTTTDTDTPSPVAELALTKVVSNPTPDIGDTITYTLTLTNNGPSDATGIVVSEAIPSGVTFQLANPAAGTTFDSVARTWSVPALANGNQVTLTVNVLVVSLTPQTNTAAIIAADQPDPVLPNNTASVTETPRLPTGSISGYVYRDYSVDGIRQPAATFPETGIGGVLITLAGTDIVGSPVNLTTTTAADGSYTFIGLAAGTYTLTESQPPPVSVPGGFYDGLDSIGTIGGIPSGSSPAKNQLQVSLNTGSIAADYSFGENPPADPFGFVYLDLNNNGIRETGEPGIPGVAITVSGTAFAGTPLERVLTAADVPTGLTVFTDANGRWEYPIIPPGVYSFVETQPAGFIDGLEGNADPNGPNTVIIGNDVFSNVLLNPNPIRGPFNFGELALNGTLEGSVYVDRNGSGTRDPEETGIWGVSITLIGTDSSGNPASATVVTDINGNFRFLGLRPGTYQLIETQPSSFLDGPDRVGSLGGIVGNDVIIAIGLGSNQTGTLYQFGEGGLLASAVSKRMFLASTTLADFIVGDPGSGVATVTYGLANAAVANANVNVNVNGLAADPGAPVIFQQDANLPAAFAANLNSGFSEPNVGTSTTTSTTTGNTGNTTTPSGNSTPPATNLAIPTLLTTETTGSGVVEERIEETGAASEMELANLERSLDSLFVSLNSEEAVGTTLPTVSTVEATAVRHDAPPTAEIESPSDSDENHAKLTTRSSGRGWFLCTLASMFFLANSPWKRSRKKKYKSLLKN